MKKFIKAITLIWLSACLVFWGADKSLDWLIEHLNIVVLANGDISLPETTEETTTAETKADPTKNPEETLPVETLPEETIPETLPVETQPEITTPEETLAVAWETTVTETTEAETKQVETILIGYNESETTIPVTTIPETTVPVTTVPETTTAAEPIDPADSPEVLAQLKIKYNYQQMSEQEQKIYRQLYYAWLNLEPNAYVENVDNSIISDVGYWMLEDCPEIFWTYGSYNVMSIDRSTGKKVLKLTYDIELRKIPDLRERIEKVVSQLMGEMPQGSDYEKVKWAYEAIIKMNTYDLNAENIRNIQGTFLDGNGVCVGYAKSFLLLMQRADIMCTLVYGDAGGPHRWDVVQLDGKWYHVDPTWGDRPLDGTDDYPDGRNIFYGYLCVNDDMIELTHETSRDVADVPACKALDYNYHNMIGNYFDHYNKNDIYNRAKEVFKGDSKVFEMRFADGDDYRRAVDAFQNGLGNDIVSYYETVHGGDWTWTSQKDNALNVYIFQIIKK